MKSPITRPMLAGSIKKMELLQYPVICSPKLDGIRCLKVNGQVVSRTFKPIPNNYIRERLWEILPEGADGEIMVGDTFQECTSAVMSYEGEPDFQFWMFDLVSSGLDEPYRDRVANIEQHVNSCAPELIPVPTVLVENEEQLLNVEEAYLNHGYEGVMVRDPFGPYKCGRSTEKQGWLLKLKRFVDSEAEIVGYEEQQKNTNTLEKNELGLAKRSSAKGGKVGKGTLGKFLVRDIHSGIEFKIGHGEGLTDELRQEIWNDPEGYMGALVKYRSQPHGVKEKPRIPVFIGFRDPRDL